MSSLSLAETGEQPAGHHRAAERQQGRQKRALGTETVHGVLERESLGLSLITTLISKPFSLLLRFDVSDIPPGKSRTSPSLASRNSSAPRANSKTPMLKNSFKLCGCVQPSPFMEFLLEYSVRRSVAVVTWSTSGSHWIPLCCASSHTVQWRNPRKNA